MYNFYAKFAKILEICKIFLKKILLQRKAISAVRDRYLNFSDLEVIALSLTAESESIDSEKVVIRLQIAGV